MIGKRTWCFVAIENYYTLVCLQEIRYICVYIYMYIIIYIIHIHICRMLRNTP